MTADEVRDQVAASMERIILILQDADARNPGISLEIMANLLGLVLATNQIPPERTQQLFATVEKAAELCRAHALAQRTRPEGLH